MIRAFCQDTDSFHVTFLGNLVLREEFSRSLLAGARGSVAIDDDRVVGFAMWVVTEKGVIVRSVAVHPEFRGIGIGRSLVSSAPLTSGRNFVILDFQREEFARRCVFFSGLGYEFSHFSGRSGYMLLRRTF